MFQGNRETGSALGAALQAAFKLMVCVKDVIIYIAQVISVLLKLRLKSFFKIKYRCDELVY